MLNRPGGLCVSKDLGISPPDGTLTCDSPFPSHGREDGRYLLELDLGALARQDEYRVEDAVRIGTGRRQVGDNLLEAVGALAGG